MIAGIPTRPLAQISRTIDYGVTASASHDVAGKKFLRITDIQDGSVDWASVPYCVAPESKLRSACLTDGDIVFARTGATTGKSFLIKSPPDGAVFASYLIRVKPSTEVEPAYLAHFFQSAGYWAQIRKKTQGAAQGGVNASSLSELEIPLPPLDEQRRIAAILDKADALRRKRKRALDLLSDLSDALFRDTFVIAEERSWPTVAVDDLATDMRTGPFGSQLLHSEFVSEGIAVIGIDNAVSNEFRWAERRFITEEKFEKLRRYQVFPGDLIITIMGTCGRCAIIPDDIPISINTKHLCCITLDRTRCLPVFLHAAFLRHPDIQKQLGVQAKGAVMPGLNMGIVKSLKLRLPPLQLQRQFVERLEMVAAKSAMVGSSAALSRVLFSSLQHRAFSGLL